MIINMQPFTALMDIESSRSFIDDLYSSDSKKCLDSIVCIKNCVIGSNRQKESVIAQGIVPRLMQLLKEKTVDIQIRIEAAVTLGSLAKGKEDHVELLLNSGAIYLLLEVLEEDEPKLINACLSCLKTLAQQDLTVGPVDKYTTKRIQRLLTFASPKESIQRQMCVASILKSACKTVTDQVNLCNVGAHHVLASLLCVKCTNVRIPALACLASMCFNNHAVAIEIACAECQEDKIPNYVGTLACRYRPSEMQLEAARCLTNLHRAGAIAAASPAITFRTLPCLARLCEGDQLEQHKAAAADIMAYLIEVDSELQKLASISNQFVGSLVDLLECPSIAAKQAAFRAFASLGANDEDIRKRMMDNKCLMEKVMAALEDENMETRMAAVRCLHSLSRSVQQLRTSFQDYPAWKPLMSILLGNPSTDLLTAASSALCNLLLEFSPAKEPMVQQGVVNILANLTSRPEASLRLNGVWALMNLAFQAEQRVKSQILTALGTVQIFKLLADSDTRVLMKTLGLFRNLVSPRAHTDIMMALHGSQVMQGVILVLEGPHAPEVKEQALCILGNIADGDRARDHIMSNEDVLKKLIDYMTHPALCLQETSIFCINNLCRKGEPGAQERQNRLKELGVVNVLQQLLSTTNSVLYNRVKTAHSQFLND